MDRVRRVAVGDVSLFVRQLGLDSHDSPPLLAVHGGPDWDHSYLLPGLDLVARHRQVIAFDLRGCGRSSSPRDAGRYQPEYLVDDIAHLITALGYDRVDLLGFSTGGQVAQLVVASRPELLRRLILASTTAYADVTQYLDHWQEYNSRCTITVPWPAWAGFERGDGTSPRHRTIEWAIDTAPTAIWNLDRLNEYLELLGDVRFTGNWLTPYLQGRLHPWRPADPGQALRDFTGETLILHGAQDMCFPVQVAERLAEAAPGATLALIENAGHMAHFDQPETWADTIVEFLD
jgi:pimeloyl-ACP methyl ester carboxylesterase